MGLVGQELDDRDDMICGAGQLLYPFLDTMFTLPSRFSPFPDRPHTTLDKAKRRRRTSKCNWQKARQAFRPKRRKWHPTRIPG